MRKRKQDGLRGAFQFPVVRKTIKFYDWVYKTRWFCLGFPLYLVLFHVHYLIYGFPSGWDVLYSLLLFTISALVGLYPFLLFRAERRFFSRYQSEFVLNDREKRIIPIIYALFFTVTGVLLFIDLNKPEPTAWFIYGGTERVLWVFALFLVFGCSGGPYVIHEIIRAVTGYYNVVVKEYGHSNKYEYLTHRLGDIKKVFLCFDRFFLWILSLLTIVSIVIIFKEIKTDDISQYYHYVVILAFMFSIGFVFYYVFREHTLMREFDRFLYKDFIVLSGDVDEIRRSQWVFTLISDRRSPYYIPSSINNSLVNISLVVSTQIIINVVNFVFS